MTVTIETTDNYDTRNSDRDKFIAAMSFAVNGVSVVTTNGMAGRFGLTVSAVSSVSAEPPLVLACVNKGSPVSEAITKNGVFCINLLTTEQQYISDVFSGRTRQGNSYDFNCAQWIVKSTGAPILVGAASSFDCHLEQMYRAGSHSIFIGAVATAKTSGNDALLYSRHKYGRLSHDLYN